MNLMSHIHPDASCWRVELLNERSENLFIEKEWDDGFFLSLKTKISEWIEPEPGQPKIYVKDCTLTAWTFDTRKQVDEMIRMLKKIRNEIVSLPKPQDKPKP